jgi:hypothetical protein
MANKPLVRWLGVPFRRLSPANALDAFIAANLAFLAVDVALAHAANRFARNEEWWPVAVSLLATLLLLPGLTVEKRSRGLRLLEIAVGAISVSVGIVGVLFHLRSAFFEEQTLVSLVYSAPFAAPLAYVGLGLLLIMARMEAPEGVAWPAWVLFFTLGGFVGNFSLALLDHAQNGFFSNSEWVAVAGAAFGTSFLALVLLRPADLALARALRLVLALEGMLGLLGFALHFRANLGRTGPWWDRALYGAPTFAPLLFADLALLGMIGLWSRARASEMHSVRRI